jgi:hypothetical protein
VIIIIFWSSENFSIGQIFSKSNQLHTFTPFFAALFQDGTAPAFPQQEHAIEQKKTGGEHENNIIKKKPRDRSKRDWHSE